MHAALRPGGLFLLEPQPWSSYRKNAGLAPHLLRNYGAIQIKPPQFRELLLGEIGFATCEELSAAAAVLVFVSKKMVSKMISREGLERSRKVREGSWIIWEHF